MRRLINFGRGCQGLIEGTQLHRWSPRKLKNLQSQGSNYASASRIPEARSLSSISTPYEEVEPRLINDSNREDAGNNLKRKASVQPLDSAGKRSKIASAAAEKEDNLYGDVHSRSPEISQLSGKSFQNLQHPDKCTSDVEEIDSFTVVMSDPPKTSNQESGTRKAVPTKLRQSPRRKKHQDQSSRPQPSLEPPTANFSPYVVFHRCKLHALNCGPEYPLFREAQIIRQRNAAEKTLSWFPRKRSLICVRSMRLRSYGSLQRIKYLPRAHQRRR